MNPAALAEPLAQTALARWLQSGWVFPIVESAHIVSFALLFGAIAVVDARLLGALRHLPAAPLLRSALPLAGLGFAGAVVTGSLLFVANAGELLANRAFVAKIALLMLAGLNAAWFHASATKEALAADGPPDASMRAAGALSIASWIAVIVAGRLIAYV
ncbi:MAG TPA: hypothetical protein VEA81_10405 [Burkholderiaceae bacterium]|nr:hypothetical protein [Burkholderiaceae bacterium]